MEMMKDEGLRLQSILYYFYYFRSCILCNFRGTAKFYSLDTRVGTFL